MSIESLTAAQCTLLAVHYAAEGNIQALHSFTPKRLDAFEPELVLKILLTYLPETREPRTYISYVSEVASRLYIDVTREDIEVDTTPVTDIDDGQARQRVKKLHLLEIVPPAFPPHAPEDLLTRAFLERNDFIRIWYVGVVLPLLRLNYEYYPTNDTPTSLIDFEKLGGREGIDFLLGNVTKDFERSVPATEPGKSMITRDVKGLVGPWMYGHTERKRRKYMNEQHDNHDSVDSITNRVRKISLSGVQESDKTGHDWEYAYKWMVFQAQQHFPVITQLIDEWDGVADLDLGGFDKSHRFYLNRDVDQSLQSQYAQAAFASCYAAQADTEATIRGAHGVLARLAELLDFIPPPDLATSVESLPKVERHATVLDESQTLSDLEVDALLKPEHPLTTPRLTTYMLLQMMVYSAYQFSGVGHNISIVHVAKLQFYSTAEEQLHLLQDILNGIQDLDDEMRPNGSLIEQD